LLLYPHYMTGIFYTCYSDENALTFEKEKKVLRPSVDFTVSGNV